jgi:hypothetical protein
MNGRGTHILLLLLVHPAAMTSSWFDRVSSKRPRFNGSFNLEVISLLCLILLKYLWKFESPFSISTARANSCPRLYRLGINALGFRLSAQSIRRRKNILFSGDLWHRSHSCQCVNRLIGQLTKCLWQIPAIEIPISAHLWKWEASWLRFLLSGKD